MNLELISKIEPKKVTAVICSKMPLAELNYHILKELILTRNARVLFISVEKPHQYMAYILSMHHVPQRRLTYLDLGNAKKLAFPLTPRELKTVQIGGFLVRDFPIIQDYQYIIIDDIEYLTHFWSLESIKEFMQSIHDTTKKYGVGVIITLSGKAEELCSYIHELCDDKLSIEEVNR